MPKPKTSNDLADFSQALFPHREGSHLHHEVESFCKNTHFRTFRDPLSPDWEMPRTDGQHWTLDHWTHIHDSSASLRAEEWALIRQRPAAEVTAAECAMAWGLLAAEAWGLSDRACRYLVAILAEERRSAWTHRDQRHKRGKEKLHPLYQLPEGAEVVPMTHKLPSARELARELATHRAYEASAAKEAAAGDADGRDARAVAALHHVSAALFAMLGARRLFNRAHWIAAAREAVIALHAVQTDREASAMRGPYPEAQRRDEARRLTNLVFCNRAKYINLTVMRRPTFANAAGVGPRPNARANDLFHRFGVPAATAEEIALGLELSTFSLREEPMGRDHALVGAFAMRFRGWEADLIDSAPVWASAHHYTEKEREEIPVIRSLGERPPVTHGGKLVPNWDDWTTTKIGAFLALYERTHRPKDAPEPGSVAGAGEVLGALDAIEPKRPGGRNER